MRVSPGREARMPALTALPVAGSVWFAGLVVFLEQIGLPLPAMPILILAGSFVADGRIHGGLLVIAVLTSTILADVAWFAAGRRFGERALRFVRRLAPGEVGSTRLARSRNWALLLGKFVPGVSMVSVPFAGASGMPFGTFLLLDLGGAMLWSGSGILAGLLFHDEVDAVLLFLARLGRMWIAVLLVGLCVYLLRRFVPGLRAIAHRRQQLRWREGDI
jgi:membrane protein DedA with SNARE-associated domain